MVRPIPGLLTGLLLLAFFFSFSSGAVAASRIWVDPIRGSDRGSGSPDSPLRSLDQAWRRVPTNNARVEIFLAAGDYRDLSPNYWENKRGRIEIQANGAAVLPAVNLFRVAGLSFRGVTFGGDIHCELCTNFSLINVRAHLTGAWEVIKINQSRGVTIRNSRFSGAGDNVLDLVAVQRARIFGNSFSDAGDWCGYVKGGSTDVVVRDNIFRDCGTGGFTVGQGTGFQFMTPHSSITRPTALSSPGIPSSMPPGPDTESMVATTFSSWTTLLFRSASARIWSKLSTGCAHATDLRR